MKLIGSHGCFQQKLNTNAYMLNEDEAIYIHGKHIVSIDIKKKSQKFRYNNADDQDSTAFAIHNSENVNKCTAGVAFRG
jgi:trehalose-6-phosphatase